METILNYLTLYPLQSKQMQLKRKGEEAGEGTKEREEKGTRRKKEIMT